MMAKAQERDEGPNDQDAGQDKRSTLIIPAERIESRILLIREQKVILDSDLAALYGVETRVLVQAVKRNRVRFPSDFLFPLTKEEFAVLRSQFVISNILIGRGGRRYPPYAFTEHGAIMAASILNSEQAVRTSIFVVRAFVRLRRMLAQNQDLAVRLERVEEAVGTYDRQIVAIVDALHLLMPPEEELPREPFGFRRAKKN